MDAELLLSFIKKYYLDGIVEECKWEITPTNITVKFLSTIGDCVGEVILTQDTGLDNTTIGILNNTSFISMVNIMEGPLSIEVEKSTTGIPMKIVLSDNNYENNYHLADLNLFRKVPRVEEPEYDLVINIDADLANKFTKSKGALNKEISRCTIESGTQNNIPGLKIVVGGKESLSHKIKIFHEDPNCKGKVPVQPFNADILKAIFQANKSFDSGLLKISKEGLACITLNIGNITCKYFVVKMNEEN